MNNMAIKRPRSVPALIGSMALLILSAISAQGASLVDVTIPAAPPEVEILEVDVDGPNLSVLVNLESGTPPGETFEIRFLADDGVLVSSVLASAPAGSQELDVLLEGYFTELGSRGRQHRLEVLRSDGTAADAIDLRLGLDCDATGLCAVQARSGLYAEGALELSADLATHFSPNKPTDLSKLVQTHPELRGRIFEFSIDMQSLFSGSQDGCVCFYTFNFPSFDGASETFIETTSNGSMEEPVLWIDYYEDLIYLDSQLFQAGQASMAQMDIDFSCFTVVSLVQAQASITSGFITSDLGVLDPCPDLCPAPVDWELKDMDYSTDLDPGGQAHSSSDYGIDWSVDGTPAYSFASAFSTNGGSVLSIHMSGQAVAPALLTGQSAPTSSQVTLQTGGEVGAWTMVDLPAMEMLVEAAHKATGSATCAAPAEVTHSLLRVAGGGKATLAVVLGPDPP